MSTFPPETIAHLAIAAEANGLEWNEDLLAALAARRDERKARGGKKCDICYQTKSLDAFSMDSSRPDGLRRICKECDSAVKAERYRRDRMRFI